MTKKYREIIRYIIVGLLTTVVSYGVRLAILYVFSAVLSINLDNATAADTLALRAIAPTVGWIAAVLFAFYPSKVWVFRDEEKGKRTLIQFFEFVGSRVGTYFIEMGMAVLLPMFFSAVGYKPFRFIVEIDADLLTSGISIVVITVLNYVLSKLLVFKKKKS